MWKADIRARLETSAVWRYGLPVVSVAAALAATYVLQPYVFRTPLFFLAILISAWLGGTGPGLLTVLLSTLCIGFFLSPHGVVATRFPNVPSVAAFLLTSLMVGAWGLARRRAEYALQHARDDLETKVQERTADLSRSNDRLQQEINERKQAEEQLNVTSEQLRALSASLQSAREEEGTRIARELHDELGSSLTGLRWGLDEVSGLLSTATHGGETGKVREKIAALTTLIESTFETVRRIAAELRPGILDEAGLVAAIEWAAKEFEERTEIICRFKSSMENVHLSREQSTAIFRIFQEALTNILRHAEATHVGITMKEQADEFVLTITDNGRGITEGEKSQQQSLGILGMRERAHLMGGDLEIKGIEGRGTVITVRVPVLHRDKVLKMTR
ncbi:MAG: sensor histidine kinase [Pyrinomonadaceae bacterium]|nr:sensor histidine kinase [Pyrinomonadaceae bacterium]